MAPSIVSDIELPRDIPESRQSSANVPIEKAFGLKDRTIIITGAGRGLGITLAVAVLESGADAVCLDILSEPSAEEWNVITKLEKSTGVRATYQVCDITNEEAVEKIVAECGKEARQRGKPVRGMISCAGIQQMVDAIDYPMDGLRKIMEVNVAGSFLISKYTARLLRDQKLGGSIVLIASMSGQIANRGLHCSAYNTSKAAVHQMGRSLAYEWGQWGIRVNTLSPGYIRTAMTDGLLQEKPEVEESWMRGALLGRLGAPEDFKAPCVFLLADGSSWMTGADLRVDGGHCATS